MALSSGFQIKADLSFPHPEYFKNFELVMERAVLWAILHWPKDLKKKDSALEQFQIKVNETFTNEIKTIIDWRSSWITDKDAKDLNHILWSSLKQLDNLKNKQNEDIFPYLSEIMINWLLSWIYANWIAIGGFTKSLIDRTNWNSKTFTPAKQYWAYYREYSDQIVRAVTVIPGLLKEGQWIEYIYCDVIDKALDNSKLFIDKHLLTQSQLADIIANQKLFWNSFTSNLTTYFNWNSQNAIDFFEGTDIKKNIIWLFPGWSIFKGKILNTLRNWQKWVKVLPPELESFDIFLNQVFKNVTKVKQIWSIKWKNVCITGTLKMTRYEVEDLITKKWWYDTNTVTSTTDILVIADPTKKSSKQTKGESIVKNWWKLVILTEDEFWDLIAIS